MFAKFNIRTVLLSSSSLTEDMMEKLGMGPIKGPCWVGFIVEDVTELEAACCSQGCIFTSFKLLC